MDDCRCGVIAVPATCSAERQQRRLGQGSGLARCAEEWITWLQLLHHTQLPRRRAQSLLVLEKHVRTWRPRTQSRLVRGIPEMTSAELVIQELSTASYFSIRVRLQLVLQTNLIDHPPARLDTQPLRQQKSFIPGRAPARLFALVVPLWPHRAPVTD